MEDRNSSSENLINQWEDFRIVAEDRRGLVLDEAGTGEDELNLRWCLIGRLLNNRPVDFEALRNVLAALWRPVKGLFVKELEVNHFLFQFFHELDIQRVMEGTPWTFNRIPLLLERLKLGENPRSLKLTSLAVWVQVYDL